MADISFQHPISGNQIAPPIVGDIPEVSVVLPCLNEVETLGRCLVEARIALEEHFLRGEILVADNGSTDGSQEVATSLGARVVAVPCRGYGSALRGGIAAARGEFVIFGDADDSYDFGDIPRFVEQLRDGADLAMGNRFRGGIQPGAMPWLHRYLGNPVLTAIGKLLFACPAGDFHCGLRGFRKTAYDKLQIRSTGMEFASEMLIQASLHGWRVTEIPTKLYPDGRSRPPHLRTWRDGWRHLRFMLLCSPNWLFAIPGVIFCGTALLFGLLCGYGVLPRASYLLFSVGLLTMLGQQCLLYGLVAKRLLISERVHPSDAFGWRISGLLSLERGLILGSGMVLAGVCWLGTILPGAVTHSPDTAIAQILPASTLVGLGVQTIFGSCLLGLLAIFKSNA